jgi:hypothetical protein
MTGLLKDIKTEDSGFTFWAPLLGMISVAIGRLPIIEVIFCPDGPPCPVLTVPVEVILAII